MTAGFIQSGNEKIERIHTGKRYGLLTCIDTVGKSNTGNDIWLCNCDCGNSIYVNSSMLIAGVQKSCGCRSTRSQNLQGRKFGRLTVVEPTGRIEPDGSINWLCYCECGKQTCVSSNKLLTGRTKSCGCLKREAMAASKTYVDGTCLEQIVSRKNTKNNTSGIKGVYRNRNRWCSYIVYAKKTYFLGRFESIEEAANIRRAAEKMRINHVKSLCLGKIEPSFEQKLHILLLPNVLRGTELQI